MQIWSAARICSLSAVFCNEGNYHHPHLCTPNCPHPRPSYITATSHHSWLEWTTQLWDTAAGIALIKPVRSSVFLICWIQSSTQFVTIWHGILLVLTCTHSYSLVLTRTHPYSLVLTRTHPYSLVLTRTLHYVACIINLFHVFYFIC